MLKLITIISGKGGTGKTTFTAALAYLLENKAIIADADVDAPDLHLILDPKIKSKTNLNISKKIKRFESKCIKCEICTNSCRFDAITATSYDTFRCESCLLCQKVCPEDALEVEIKKSAEIYKAKSRFGYFVYANMSIGEGNSGRIVDSIRTIAKKLAINYEKEYILIDGSPGIGCPVIASITGIDIACIIVEPTLSGIHDLERLIANINHFNVKPLVVINKYDLNIEMSEKITNYCIKNDIIIAGKIPFDKIVPQSILEGKSIFEMQENNVATTIKEIWNKINSILKK